MLVKNTEARVIGFGMPKGGNVYFYPGVNNVSDVDWNEISKHPHAKTMLDGKILEILKSPRATKDNAGEDEQAVESVPLSTDSIVNVPSRQVKSIIDSTLKMDLLERWHDEETRATVKAQIKKQMEKLKIKPREETQNA